MHGRWHVFTYGILSFEFRYLPNAQLFHVHSFDFEYLCANYTPKCSVLFLVTSMLVSSLFKGQCGQIAVTDLHSSMPLSCQHCMLGLLSSKEPTSGSQFHWISGYHIMPHLSISKQHAKGTAHHWQSPNTAWGFQCRGAGLEKALVFFSPWCL